MSDKRFEEVFVQKKPNYTKVLRDNETGVLYMYHQEGYGAGLTVMLDQDGKPLVDQDFKKNVNQRQPIE